MTYPCCEHCVHDDELDGPHDEPCPDGCNGIDPNYECPCTENRLYATCGH